MSERSGALPHPPAAGGPGEGAVTSHAITDTKNVERVAGEAPTAGAGTEGVRDPSVPAERGTNSGEEVGDEAKESVKFVVHNTWTETLDHVYVQYYDLNRNEPCVHVEQVTKSWAQEFEALCMESVPVTTVGIWVSDAGALSPTDAAEIPRCCHGPEDDDNPKIHLTFEVLCFCPDDEAGATE